MEPKLVLDRHQFDTFFESLHKHGYEIIGPTLLDGAVVYAPVDSPDELPVGWTDEQQGGVYRLKRRGDQALFGYSAAAHSWKKFLFLPTLKLFEAYRTSGGPEIRHPQPDVRRRAFLGVRACEIASMEIQDRILIHGTFQDTAYVQARNAALIVAVQCLQSGGTCFCRSMNTGPEVTRGYDLLLTEITGPQKHVFIVDVGTDRGAGILEGIALAKADEADLKHAGDLVDEAAAHMGRVLDQNGIKELLYRNYEHPRWEEVAKRCLTCTNCTIVCPTCFCTTIEDVTDLPGGKAERWRRWDSCFTLDHSYLHGGCVRCSGLSRYRQWMTHKLATWIDQFGTSGCVGCGRCITWCPVGIDITEETAAIRSSGDASSSIFGKKGE